MPVYYTTNLLEGVGDVAELVVDVVAEQRQDDDDDDRDEREDQRVLNQALSALLVGEPRYHVLHASSLCSRAPPRGAPVASSRCRYLRALET